ncbi:unnamed protein product [Lupinus luteus]|uniref:Uncharacterized protein n=1 Tax=Lupinus luteus TaxID=3873 RepID=A0AAV1WAG4_LUPLU
MKMLHVDSTQWMLLGAYGTQWIGSYYHISGELPPFVADNSSRSSDSGVIQEVDFSSN